MTSRPASLDEADGAATGLVAEPEAELEAELGPGLGPGVATALEEVTAAHAPAAPAAPGDSRTAAPTTSATGPPAGWRRLTRSRASGRRWSR